MGVSEGHCLGVPPVTPRCRQADQGLLDKHYQQLRQKPFYPALLAYMTSGPLVAMVRGWDGGFGGSWGGPLGGSGVPCPTGVGGLQRGEVHAGHGGGHQLRDGGGGHHPGGLQHARQQVGERGGRRGWRRDPTATAPAPSLRRNVVHASDSVETAQREIGFWFQQDELVAWESGDRDYTYGP